MSKRLVTYKSKLKPTTEQEEKFDQWLGVWRFYLLNTSFEDNTARV